MEYLDFEIEMCKATGEDHEISVRSPAGEAREQTRLPVLDGEVRRSVVTGRDVAVADSGASSTSLLQAFGHSLFAAVFVRTVRARFDATRQLAQSTKQGVRIQLRLRTPHSAALPWELLYDAEHDLYLALSRTTVLCRYLELPKPIQRLSVAPPLRILVVISTPDGLPELDADSEQRRIEEAIAKLVRLGSLEIRWLRGADGHIERLQERLQDARPWHVLHFIGHGMFDAAASEGKIAFTDETGRVRWVSGKQLGILLGDHEPLRLAVLNCCRSAQSNEVSLFASAAAQIASSGIPAVVAMQQTVSDASAIAFAGQFYGAIVNGLSVEAAVSEGRKAMWLAVDKEDFGWALPVLHMRSPEGCLFTIDHGEPANMAQSAKSLAVSVVMRNYGLPWLVGITTVAAVLVAIFLNSSPDYPPPDTGPVVVPSTDAALIVTTHAGDSASGPSTQSELGADSNDMGLADASVGATRSQAMPHPATLKNNQQHVRADAGVSVIDAALLQFMCVSIMPNGIPRPARLIVSASIEAASKECEDGCAPNGDTACKVLPKEVK